MPLPFESETFGTPEEPVLGMAVRVTPALVSELIVQLDEPPEEASGHAMQSCPLNEAIAASALRLLAAMTTPDEARGLARGCSGSSPIAS